MRGAVLAGCLLLSAPAWAVPHVTLFAICGEPVVAHWLNSSTIGDVTREMFLKDEAVQRAIAQAEAEAPDDLRKIIDLTEFLTERYGFKCPAAI